MLPAWKRTAWSLGLADLVSDIYSVLTDGREVTDAQAAEFGSGLAAIIQARLMEPLGPPREFTLRMSNIGKGGRQLWYDKRFGNEEELKGSTLLKFVYGDLIEYLLLFLVSLSGHRVTALQDEVTLKNVKGHVDSDIDGTTVDIKSASTHAFRKFATGTLEDDDPFGYIEQIAGYAKARGTDGAFLAMDKQNGTLAYLPFSKEKLDAFRVEERIDYITKVVASDEIPERCYPDEEEGKSGNRALGVNCSYCSHKGRCWADANGGLGLRTFLYSGGPKFLTKVVREPNVKEVTF